ncbi:hypothetical protein LIER_13088 [Lithospermum erythrorhizon]|uniref:Uncharacterized protein n=1 Tax=Lithospermum erythrorhizon TaxID=34254 RepID=A0AAV3PUZ4_LITER
MLLDTDSSADILYLSTYDKLVDIAESSYNGLIGIPILTALRAIVSPLHLKMKFTTTRGIREICGNQKKTRMCYQTSVPSLGKDLGKSKKRSRENHPEMISTKGEAHQQDHNSPRE